MKYQSNFLSDARGKLNGSVFSRNRFAAIIRNKTSPVNPQTAAQMLQRQNFGALSASWRALPPEEQAAWNAFAESAPRSNVFGQTYRPTGQNYYVGLNQNLLNVNIATITDPVPFSEMPVIELESTSIVLDASTPTGEINPVIDGGDTVPTGYNLLLFATPQISAGKTFVKELYRIINVRTAGASVGPWNILASYTARYGALVAGQKVFFKLVLVNTASGQASVPVTAGAIVVP